MPNKRIHSEKIKLRRFALQLYFTGDARSYVKARTVLKIGD